MIKTKMKYDFDDLLIEPSSNSKIISRSECNPFFNGKLPLITAPMDTVINNNNYNLFNAAGILTVKPRQKEYKDLNYSYDYVAVSLNDFEKTFLSNNFKGTSNVLIDVANGHMPNILEMTKKAREKYGDKINLLVGNIANPVSFDILAPYVNGIRIGIGNGNSCLTTQNTGVGYPMASLINECKSIRNRIYDNHNVLIIADGGMKKYSDIIKALGLGADLVMIGSILNKCLESAAETKTETGVVINQYDKNKGKLYLQTQSLYKNFRGMSTKTVQKEWGKEKLTTSEGIEKIIKVEYTLNEWVSNFTDYLKSAMSYVGMKDLKHFKQYTNFNLISMNALNRFTK